MKKFFLIRKKPDQTETESVYYSIDDNDFYGIMYVIADCKNIFFTYTEAINFIKNKNIENCQVVMIGLQEYFLENQND